MSETGSQNSESQTASLCVCGILKMKLRTFADRSKADR